MFGEDDPIVMADEMKQDLVQMLGVDEHVKVA